LIDHSAPTKSGSLIFKAKIEESKKMLVRKAWISSKGDILFAISDNSKLWFSKIEPELMSNITTPS
jgi:hypothetical protein